MEVKKTILKTDVTVENSKKDNGEIIYDISLNDSCILSLTRDQWETINDFIIDSMIFIEEHE